MALKPDRDTLFDQPDYTAWCRVLHQHMPLPADAHVLFESTIAEPTALIAKAARGVFGKDGVSDRFQSVFGRGNGHLIDALAKRYGAQSDQIVTTTGAASSIAMTLRAFGRAEDLNVVVENPSLDLISHIPRSAGARVSLIERRAPDFAIDPDDFRRALRGGSKIALITNPHNPSGMTMPDQDLVTLAAIADDYGALLLVDEVYADFAYRQGSPRPRPHNLVRVNSLTKVFGLFSLRCGWILADAPLARRIEEANARGEFGVSKLTHAIAAHVIENPEPFDRHWQNVLRVNRPILEHAAQAMFEDELIDGDLPDNGCMYFPRVVGCSDTHALADWLWRAHNLIVAPGEFFGRAGHFRLGFGLDDARLKDGLAALHRALRERRIRPSSQPHRRIKQ